MAFLFFYGLERRILVDSTQQPLADGERRLIHAEVERLLSLYGSNNSFNGYATEFLALLMAADANYVPGEPPSTREGRWQAIPLTQTAVGYFAKAGMPVNADWALAWARCHPEIPMRTPSIRCHEEFGQLFNIRYTSKYGDGLVVKPGKRMLRSSGYQSASAGIGHVSTPSTLPDVFSQAAARKALLAIVEECTQDLESYSRYLGKHPEAQGTLPAIALLPAELVPTSGGQLEALDFFLDAQLGDHGQVAVDAGRLLEYWPHAEGGLLSKAESVSLAQLLGTRHIGIEPDVRFGGSALAAGTQVVLFRLGSDQLGAATAEYTAATLVAHLAAAVAASDGAVHAIETSHLRDHIESGLGLSDGEQRRLHAHLTWLLTGPLKLTGLTKRLAALTSTQRESIGAFVVGLAAADGIVTPDEVKSLTAIYKLLGLDPGGVFSSVHAATLKTQPAVEPVTVRDPSAGPPSYAIPAPSSLGTAPTQLDLAAIAVKLAETVEVSALLAGIFAEDPAPEAAYLGNESSTDAPDLVAGLDSAHSSLLRSLAAQSTWTRAELETLCAESGLLPDGAIDTLNEAAYQTVGDPVIEGEDVLSVDKPVAEEMLQ